MKTITFAVEHGSAEVVRPHSRRCAYAFQVRRGMARQSARSAAEITGAPPPKTDKQRAREKSIEAAELLVRVTNDPDAGYSERIKAASLIVDRAFGKATVEVGITELSKLAAMSEEEPRIYVVSGILPEGI